MRALTLKVHVGVLIRRFISSRVKIGVPIFLKLTTIASAANVNAARTTTTTTTPDAATTTAFPGLCY